MNRNGFRQLNYETQNTYYCSKCNIQHRRNSRIGKLHSNPDIPPVSQETIAYALKHNVER